MASVRVLKHFELPKKEGLYYRLICLTGPNKGSAYFFSDQRIVLGRSEKADIKIQDVKTSREHAEIVVVGKDLVITDLGSQNGITVNDLKVKQHKLSDGDKIIIGQTVYKFSFVEVKDAILTNDSDKKMSAETEEEKPKKKKNNTILIIIILFSIGILLLDDGGDNKEVKRKSTEKYKVSEMSDPLLNLQKKKKIEDQKSQEKLQIYFHQGLREYREGNYFRAIAEFQHALSWSPQDALAEFYLRKTKEALDKQIEEYFLNARRDEESLKYQSAIVSYCSIVRLLNNFKDDKRYTNAIDGIKSLKKILGEPEDSIDCFQNSSKSETIGDGE